MLYLLDTDTCSYAIRYACATLDARLAAAKAGSLAQPEPPARIGHAPAPEPNRGECG